MKVSIIMPFYNAEKYLKRAILSVLGQTFIDFELILINDGSTDQSISIIDNFSDSRIRLIDGKENLGLAARLNEGIAASMGNYVARMDADDICYSDRLLLQVNFLDNNANVDLLSGRIVEIDMLDNYVCTRSHIEVDSHLKSKPWMGFLMPHPTWMGRRSWFEKNKYKIPAPYCSEDQELLLRAHKNSVYHSLPTIILAYRTDRFFKYKKRFLTRLEILNYSIKYFSKNKNYIAVLFVILAFVSRGALDLSSLFFNNKNKYAFNEADKNEYLSQLRRLDVH